MAAANLVVKLLLENDGFDKNIKSAKASIEGFEKVGKNVMGTLTKVGSALGIATTAVEAFQQIVKASQTTSDAWDATIRTCKNSVDGFFTAIATGDFSYMERGFEMIKQKAKEAAAAIDQLGNTTMSYNFFTSKNDAAFQTALQQLKDKTLDADTREQARKTAIAIIGEQEEISKVMGDTLDEVLRKTVTEKNSLSWLNVSKADIEDILRIDVMSNRDSEKERLTKEYEEYQRIREEAKEWVKENKRGKYSTTWGFNKLVETRMESMGVTKEKYKDAILYQEMLVKNGDEWLQNLINIAKQYDDVIRKMATMKQAMNEGHSIDVTQGITTTTTKAKKAQAVENQSLYGSIKWFETEIDKLTKEANSIDLSVDKAKYDDTMAKIKKLQLERDALLKVGTVEIPDLSDTSWMEDMEFDTKQVKVIDETNDALTVYQTNINNVANSLTNLSSVMSNNAGSWLQWASNVLNALASALPSIVGTSSANEILKKSMKALSKETATYGMAQMNAATATYNVAAANVAEAASIELLKKVKEEDTNATVKNTVANEAAENSNMSLVNSIRELIPAKTAEAAASAGAETAKAGPLGWLATAGAIATIIAAFASIPKFADGGIVSSPFTSGDKVLARVNGGEMILNKHQQSNLFNLLDGGATTSGSRQVEFKISGKELVGVLNNYNNKMSKLR